MSRPVIDPHPIGVGYNGRPADHPVSPLFLGRWSPRAFTGEPIPQATWLTLFEAARWAPSAYNSQPWRFIHARRHTQAFEAFLNVLIPYNQAWAKSASALAVVLSKASFVTPGKSKPTVSASASFDTGAAWASLAFQAYKLGWATHGMTGFDAEAARRVVKAPADHRLETIIAIGKRADPGTLPAALAEREKPNARRPLSETASETELP